MAKSLVDSILDSVFDSAWKGRRGEKLTERELKLVRLFGRKGEILRNAYVPKPDGTTSEIDVLYVTVKGVFVIESKNYSGWIFGSEDQFRWTVVLKGGKKERFYNPVMQNMNHVKWLGSYLGQDVPLFSIIVFSERCELKRVTIDSDDVYVIKRDRLYAMVRSIWKKTPDVLSEDEVEALYRRLLPLTGKTVKERQRHVDQIRGEAAELAHDDLESLRADATPLCPRCGAPMVLRTAKRGEHAGEQFYGCSTYPKCRAIVSIGSNRRG